MTKSVLILTQSGGSGHLKLAEERRLTEEQNGNTAIVKNIFLDFLGSTLGEIAIWPWNTAQKYGLIFVQNAMISRIAYTNYLFYQIFYYQVLKNLRSLPGTPLKVITTELTGLRAILSAVNKFNREQRKKDKNWQDIFVENWFANFPTENAFYYFNALRAVQEKYKSLLLHVIPCNRAHDLDNFCKLSGFPNSQVRVLADHELPVFPVFKEDYLKNLGNVVLKPKLTSEQWERIRHLPNTVGFIDKEGYLIPVEDCVYLWMLGSQPTYRSSLNFVISLLKTGRYLHKHRHLHVIVLCGEDKSLFNHLCEIVKNSNPFPEALSIIPLPAQDSSFIALAMSRADKCFTRAGGGTVFEHLFLKQHLGERAGKVYIMSDLILKPEQSSLTVEEKRKLILDSIPIHEKENTFYIMDKLDAVPVNSDTLADEIESDFTS